jgi:hypothetical protein
MSDGVKYYPPSHEVLVHFAHDVGQELGGVYAEREVVNGLAGFLGVVARVLADERNRKTQAGFDSRIE